MKTTTTKKTAKRAPTGKSTATAKRKSGAPRQRLSPKRSSLFPDLPTVAEAGVPGYSAESWYGLFAPAKTPAEIIDRLNRAAATAVKAETFKKLSVNEGLVMVASPPAELDRYFRGEEERWRKVIRDAGIKIE